MFHLSIEILKSLPPGEPFADGFISNSMDGLFMTNTGGTLRWVAIKGRGYNDWAVYCHWATTPLAEIVSNGDKVTFVSNIRKCISCDAEVLALYRK